MEMWQNISGGGYLKEVDHCMGVIVAVCCPIPFWHPFFLPGCIMWITLIFHYDGLTPSGTMIQNKSSLFVNCLSGVFVKNNTHTHTHTHTYTWWIFTNWKYANVSVIFVLWFQRDFRPKIIGPNFSEAENYRDGNMSQRTSVDIIVETWRREQPEAGLSYNL